MSGTKETLEAFRAINEMLQGFAEAKKHLVKIVPLMDAAVQGETPADLMKWFEAARLLDDLDSDDKTAILIGLCTVISRIRVKVTDPDMRKAIDDLTGNENFWPKATSEFEIKMETLRY